MSCRTSCCRKLSLIFALLALALMAAPAFAQNNCLADVSSANSCTANDVSIAAVKQGTVNVFKGGIPGTNQCIAGGTFSFTAEFEVKTTSSSTRSNVGIYFGTGQNNALSGTCTNAILAPAHPCAYVNGSPTATCGDANYSEKDTDKNGESGINDNINASCGDTASGDSSADFGPGTHQATLEVLNATCPATGTACPASTGFTGSCLALPTCSSWYQPAKNMPVCVSPYPDYPWVPAAIPGAPSKCTCGIVYVPVTPITVAPIVQKACTTTLTPGPATFTQNPNTQSPTTCDAGEEGSTATYTVAITNTSDTPGNNVVVDQICDNRFGNVFTDAGFAGPPCAAGTVGTATNVSCPPSPIAPGATGTCTFTAAIGENASVTDTVSASGHSSLNTSSTFTNTQSNTVTVTSSDAPSTATTTKGVDTIAHGCATVRYTVDVHNSSGADEDLTLSALNDSGFGSITSVHGDVQGTTCGQPVPANGVPGGIGTLSGSDGAGVLPHVLPVGGADYQCKFDAQICGDLTTINLPNPPGGTCLGLQHTNKVTPTLAGDEGEAVTQSGNTLTEDVCFTHLEDSTIP